jgi:3-oxoacyl-[acyl-carrier-protein] synthase-3
MSSASESPATESPNNVRQSLRTQRRAKIRAVALHHPERLVTNQFFNDLYQKDLDTFLRTQRNIYQRYFMAENEATSDLILPAAQRALEQAGLKPSDLDLIIVATDTPDFVSPSTASVVHSKLGATNAGAFDVNAACAGFVTALDLAAKYIQGDERIQNILVVGAYGMSKFLNFDDYKIASLFADGAGCAVIQATTDPDEGLLETYLWADGSYHDAMGIYAGGTAQPIHHDTLDKKSHLLNFVRKIPPEFNAHHWPRVAHLLLDRARLTTKDVRHFFLTQINIDSIHQTMDALKVPRERSFNIMNTYGYTGSACLPMAMAQAQSEHILKKGDLILMIGSGGGVSMGGVLLRWSYDT